MVPVSAHDRARGRTRSRGRSLEWNFFNHEQNEFSRMGSGRVIVFQGSNRQALGVPRFSRAAASDTVIVQPENGD